MALLWAGSAYFTSGYQRLPPGPGGWELLPVRVQFAALFSLPSFSLSTRGLSLLLPLWILLVPTAIVTAYLFWRDRRIPSHCCQGCGYELTGNVSGTCPECGSSTQSLSSM